MASEKATAFFRNIWLTDELGSGVRRLYRYVPRYSGKDPELIDGDVFRIIVPLDDRYSFDAKIGKVQDKGQINLGKDFGINETQQKMVALIAENAVITTESIAEAIGITRRQVESNMRELKLRGIVEREGGRRYGRWVVKVACDDKGAR